MNLRGSLGLVSDLGYAHRGPKTQPAQQALYQLRRDGIDGAPFGLEVRVSGQGQSLPVVPWITLLDPDVTRKVTQGLYLVYLYSADLEHVYLTMNQGATQHKNLYLEAGESDRWSRPGEWCNSSRGALRVRATMP